MGIKAGGILLDFRCGTNLSLDCCTTSALGSKA